MQKRCTNIIFCISRRVKVQYVVFRSNRCSNSMRQDGANTVLKTKPSKYFRLNISSSKTNFEILLAHQKGITNAYISYPNLKRWISRGGSSSLYADSHDLPDACTVLCMILLWSSALLTNSILQEDGK